MGIRDAQAFVEHLRGEFAFALYDQRHHTLWLGRDRFGIKPLYYAWSPRSLLFGSEIKAIFSSPVIKRALNPSFIYSYLHGLLPPDETAFVGVRQVEPGCLLRVTAAGVEPRRYWQPRFTATPAAADAPVTDRESVEEFRRLFAEAVDLRLQGDQGRCCTNRHGPARYPPTGSSPADAIRHWSAEGGHPIQDLAAEDGLTPLPSWTPGAKAITDDGLVAEERVLHPPLTMVP